MAAPALDDNLASMAFDDVVTHVQSKSRSAGLGCIERFKDFFFVLFGNSFALILDIDDQAIDISTVSQWIEARSQPFCDGDRRPCWGGVNGVLDEIDQHLLDAIGIEVDAR